MYSETSQKPEESRASRFPSHFPAKEEPPSPFYTMLRSAPPDYLTQPDEQVDFPPALPVYYFFYGTLTAPAHLPASHVFISLFQL